MKNKIKIGNFLFKYRGIIPVPFILIVLIFGSLPIALKFGHRFIISFFISLLGEFIRFLVAGYAKGETSGRGSNLAADFIVDYGLYSFIRNPLYIGNFLIFFGFMLYSGNLLFLIFGTIFFFLYYYFIVIAEENFLNNKFKDKFEEFRKNTGRFFPKNFKYKKPPYGYNFKQAIFREKDTIFIWIVSYLLLHERVCNFCKPDNHLIVFSIIMLLIWIILNIYKKSRNRKKQKK